MDAASTMAERRDAAHRRRDKRMLGEHIRAWREENGLTRRELAAILGVVEYTLYRWEHGDRQPGNGNLVDLAIEALERRLQDGLDLTSRLRMEEWDYDDFVPRAAPPDLRPDGGVTAA
jgi:transcriptional regulator with XRE-family HTH domain